jgi:hypothetical protein
MTDMILFSYSLSEDETRIRVLAARFRGDRQESVRQDIAR